MTKAQQKSGLEAAIERNRARCEAKRKRCEAKRKRYEATAASAAANEPVVMGYVHCGDLSLILEKLVGRQGGV